MAWELHIERENRRGHHLPGSGRKRVGGPAPVKLLLDPHVLLWSLLEPRRLTRRVAAELQDQTNELWLSPLSTWEVLVLAEKGRIVLQPDPAHWIRTVYRAVPFKEAPLNHEVAMESRLMD